MRFRLRGPGRCCRVLGAPAVRAAPARHTRHLPSARRRPGRGRFGPWHYWWHGALHRLSRRRVRARTPSAGPAHQAEYAGTLAHRLLRTICLRNGMRFTNHYYDDMAWLLLATQRLERLSNRSPSSADRRLTSSAVRVLADAVRSGESDELGGGLYWNDHRDFKNIAATGPAAIYLARAGDRVHASRLVDWLYATLFDARSAPVLRRRTPRTRRPVVGSP